MGNLSWLQKMMNSPEKCLINWEKANTDKLFKHWLLQDTYLSEDERPKTLADMANVWNDTKFIGYLNNSYIEALIEFNRILEPYGSFPRLYFEYEGFDELWCLEFHPGTDIILMNVFTFTQLLKKENIPKHPEEIKSYNDITTEEYQEWDDIYNAAKDKVIENAIHLIDGWSLVKKLEPSQLSEEQQLLQLVIKLSRNF
jgi:hypothetical protein